MHPRGGRPRGPRQPCVPDRADVLPASDCHERGGRAAGAHGQPAFDLAQPEYFAATPPAPVTVPTSSTAPSPTAAAIGAGPDGYQVPWSADDCGWAESTLGWDASLDAQEATAIEDGEDTRYPGQASLYATYSGRWTMIASWYAAACQGTAMIYPEWYDSMIWMNAAIQSHVTDEQADTADALWDSTWIGNYQRLESMLADVSGEWPTS